ncbi:alpha/beta fold hydrolase [Rugosimonospora acidiphila]|uniref:Alpha/beta fold hydrolase n=1 Tax=Rugosimonospora acidiphila TaxID=556531 RepID=A0ABP9RL25_9ACTN
MATFVLVPGGWHGGWSYRPIAQALRQRGHDAYPVTLTGLGDRAHLRAAVANLDTHIQDVVSVLETERITDAVLVGHSYAGMVITGVADRCPDRIGRLVYSDAYVPADGDSMWDLTTPAFRQLFLENATADGFRVAPPPGLDPRTAAHPLPSFLQKLRLSGAPSRVRRRDYLYLSGWQGSPFAGVYERLSRDPAWHTHRLPTGHNVVAEAPDKLLEILLQGGGVAARP